VKGYAGSHTVIISEGKAIPDSTKTEAATIAAFYSSAKNSEKVAVDYTAIKNVKKPPLAKAGMVTYDNFKTAFVTPSDGVVSKLKKEVN
jgi:predicted ribosome quality control (RQC) complex YloA/Tae2 family protein